MNITAPVPYLVLKDLEYLKAETDSYLMGDGWFLFNRIADAKKKVKAEMYFIEHYKAFRQIECIVENLTRIKSTIEDFEKGNMDSYIDSFLENDFNNDQEEFDPYNELKYLIGETGIQDLPVKLSQFSELVRVTGFISERNKLMKGIFRQFFPGTELRYFIEDENGSHQLLSAEGVPREKIEEIENNNAIREGFEEVKLESCLDNYDSWYASINKMIAERRTFSEMLSLFR